ncbi:SLBB domain-containing protein [Bacteroides sp. 51]|uniref:SLBB domain-containing protein n=1 Tax=Bacteroides sp. 51 TaxID=2302938 RepID=UPI0013D42E4C|nr:SLBB domain-containing protein [Bacteroides sp. 51]NDV83370.1 capsule biosynthesis protein [Bacteroides sp. 51]
MHRIITLFILVFILSGVAMAQQMSDDQVIQYLKTAQSQGKTQSQMTTELFRKGVTKEQLMRIKIKYENGEGTVDFNTQQGETDSQQRMRDSATEETETPTRSARQRALTGNVSENLEGGYPSTPAATGGGRQIFGRDMFTSRNLSFEPNSNIATPSGYRLGPGDEVIIDIWGTSENTIRETISPDGSILITNVGPVYLSGMTVNEATKYIRRELGKIYAGLLEDSSQLKLTLGQIRTIRVNIMGEVAVPGTYTLSSFSSVFHALYSAGGISPIGGMRNIQVIRNGNKIADIDVYDYIMRGKTSDDIRLMEDDVILVPPYETLVSLTGKVRRPMFYEMKKGETISDLIKYAGGFTGDAYTDNIRLIRLSGREKQIYNVDELDFATFKLFDEDVLSVETVLDRFENMVEIRGAVYRSGLYQISGGVNTVKQLIKKAEGLRGDAFLNRVQLQREKEDLTLEIIPIDLKGMLNGTTADVPLQKNDILFIPSIHDLEEQRFLVIHGQVASPGTYIYASNMTIEDLIIQAGGLLESASTVHIDVARRTKNPRSEESTNIVGTTYSFDFKDGYVIGGNGEFYLEPFDEVYIRKSPAYYRQQNVRVIGEVLFNGTYALSKKNERLTDLINRAGGLTNDAFINGARLIRKMSEEEIRRKEDALRMAKASNDSVSMRNMDLATTYPVGIDLEKALTNPNSDFNLVLREGDLLIVPEFENTVKINGAVMYPNTVSYKNGESFKYYLNQAGGYSTLAKKSKAYVVYMNGTVARLKKHNSKAVQPGCEIVIPSKDPKTRMSTGEALGIGTSVASMAAVIASLINVLK